MNRQLANFIAAALLMAGVASPAIADDDDDCDAASRWVQVSGTAIHYFTNVIEHSERPTKNGVVKRTTETIDLDGDLVGRVLYQPRSRINYNAGTLVNTGRQVFSGTVLGSKPVLLFDDEFRFDVDFFNGTTVGKVFLNDRIAGPRINCELDIIGTGVTAEGNGLASYSGRCKVRVKSKDRD
jgi:hypothetical protein